MKIKRTKGLLLVCSLLAVGCVVGGFASNIDMETAKASNETTVEMIYGARTRKTENDPGLKFEAKVNNYDKSLNYGMLIVPEAAFEKDGFRDNYHAYFAANNISDSQYIDVKCHPYQLEGDEQYYIAGSIVDINEDNYDMSFVGVAYTYDGATYSYADVNMLDNARSISYVAQMALKYEDDLTSSERNALVGFANPGQEIIDDNVLIGVGGANGDNTVSSGNTSVTQTDSYAKLNFGEFQSGYLSYTTAKAYSSITEVKVDVYIPSTNEANYWWGFAPVANANGQDAYVGSDATSKNQNLNQILVNEYGWKDRWVTLTYTVSGYSWALTITRTGMNDNQQIATFDFSAGTYQSNGASYIYVCANPGQTTNWGIWMDNFSITADGTTYTENFNSGESGFFKAIGANVVTYGIVKSEGGAEIGATPEEEEPTTPEVEGEGHAIVDFKKYSAGSKSYITTNAYSSITEVKVDVYIPSTNEANHWWGFAPVAANSGDAYAGSDATAGNQNLNQILVNDYGWKDRWVTLTYSVSGYSWTLTITRTGMNDNQQIATFDFSAGTYQSGGASYIFLCANPGQSTQWGIQMDNFSITAGGVTYTDNFNTGKSTLFTDNVNCATYYYEAPETPEAPEVPEELPAEQTKFTEMLANELLIDHILNSENYIRGNSALNFEGMPLNMAIMEGRFTYSITDYKDVVIALSVTSNYAEYLRLYNSGIALYSGHTLLKEIALDSTENTIYISVLVNGKVLVQVNDTGYVGLGQLSNQATGFAIVDVAGNGSIKFSKILIDYYTAMTYGTEGIDFTAYASMPPANWDGNAGNANMITEEQYRLMKEAGFTKVLALYEGRKASAETDALVALAICEKLGLEYYALDINFYNFVRKAVSPELYESNGATLKSNWEEIAEELIANMFNDELLYIDSPAYAGNFASDEPSMAELQMMVTQIKLYNKYVGYNAFYGGEAIVNLLPSYATAEQLGGTYVQYLDYYFENLAPLLGYACFDFYPIRNKIYLGFINSRYIQEQHLYNLQLVAQYCEQYGVEMRTFVQSLTVEDGAGVEKVTEIDELRFQIYSALAFGSQEIIYYTYTASDDTEDETKALVNFYTGATSTMYNWAKTVNNEVAAFGEMYTDYNWEKTYFNDTGSTCSQANAMVSKESYSKVSSTVDTLTGVFTHKNTGKAAYMLVNYTDPYNTSSSGSVTLAFDTATTVEIWQNGVATTQTGTSITVTLGAGNGAFVVVK